MFQYSISKYFSKKKVLITGHTGFKGSWLTFILKEAGADVLGIALPPSSEASHFDMLGLESKIDHRVVDIRDGEKISSIFKEFEPEYVFHLAAQALVRPSYDDPSNTYSTNVMGAVNILDAVKQSDSVKSLVFVTSDKCYENVEWIWGYRENDQLGGRDPYSASKAAAEIIFSSYTRSFFDSNPQLGVASVRAGNVIGGGDWSTDRIIPDCIRAISAGEAVKLRSPDATRPWQHVLEPLSGYMLLAMRLYDEPKKWGVSWNFGPATNEVRTVKDVADKIVEYIGEGSVEIVGNNEQVHEARLLQLNCDKAHQLLHWHPRWNVDKAVEATALWYKEVMEGKQAEETTRNQIYEYFKELL